MKTLSDKIRRTLGDDILFPEDVKEFIQNLKERIPQKNLLTYEQVVRIIDKLAGAELK